MPVPMMPPRAWGPRAATTPYTRPAHRAGSSRRMVVVIFSRRSPLFEGGALSLLQRRTQATEHRALRCVCVGVPSTQKVSSLIIINQRQRNGLPHRFFRFCYCCAKQQPASKKKHAKKIGGKKKNTASPLFLGKFLAPPHRQMGLTKTTHKIHGLETRSFPSSSFATSTCK